ncbi:MAG TPA: phosphate signaling complex protein PhoU [Methanospirillum sp.]|nr:phosphate signaling complex protein PhoU [Methanospirillum sp.]
MTEKSQTELENLHTSVVTFGRFALEMLKESIDAFEAQDTGRAIDVANQKRDLKAMFIPIEESLFQYLALYHPVAKDMREIAASIRIIYNLERVGRMGYDIAETTSILSKCCGLRESSTLVQMGRMVIGMIEDAINAFDERSTSNIVSMRDRDKEVDALYCQVLTEFIGRMQDEKDAVPILTRYVIIDRYLERCGDQACNMAEMIVYMITGERVEIT